MKQFDFDDHFNKLQKRNESIFKFAFGAWVVFALVTLAVIGVAVYVGAHFLAKFW